MKLIGLAVSLTCCAGFIDAQEANEPQERQQQEKHLPREVLNPEKVATQMTEQMNKLLQLTDKQYKKIYKLNLKEQKAFFKAMQNSDDYRPPMGEGPRYAGRTSANGWRTTANDGRRWFPGQNGRWWMMSRDTNSADSQKKAAETKEKKIKKILTKEQYEKWQAEQNSARKKASQRKMHKDNHPDKGGL
ncbi:hypothetical protein NXX19_03360 [Bacteroides ovatus]|nr:hypothetical protein [Bacteroides ovatus]